MLNIKQNKRLYSYALALLTTIASCNVASASDFSAIKKDAPFYIGLQTGIGSTNWSGLDAKDSGALYSAPKHSDDTGLVFGAFLGYKITPHFSVEANYLHLADSSIQMDMKQESVFKFYNNLPADGHLISHTEALNIVAHLRQEIFSTKIYAYGMAGVGMVYRHDVMAKRAVASAVFGFGIDRSITKNILAEVKYTYMSGRDQATTDPVNYFIPFVNSLNFGVAYQI